MTWEHSANSCRRARGIGAALVFIPVVTAVCLGSVSAARADSVESVTVTAARLPEPVGSAAFSVVTLDGAALSASDRLDAALGQVPGVSLFRRTSSIAANPTTQGISLRSIAPSGAGRALVLLDGVPMNDPFGGWVIWTALPYEDIGSAEIVRGAGAGPYGAGALTGTVLLGERGDGEGIAAADASAGELGTYRAAASGGTALGKVKLFGSLSGERSGGWIAVDPDRRGAADTRLRFKGGSASLRAEAPLGSGTIASARIGYYNEVRSNGLEGGKAKADGFSASLTLARAANDSRFGWRVQAWMIESDLSNVFVSVAPDRSSTTPVNDQYATPALGVGFNAAAIGTSGYFKWEAGADLRDDAGESHEHFLNVGGVFRNNRRAGGRIVVGGLYGEAAYDTGAWLLTAGARADRWATSQGHLVQSVRKTGAVTVLDTPPSRNGIVPTGRLGARYNFPDGQYLRTAAYAGFRPPTLNELYRPFRVSNDVTNANAALNPEKLYGAEAGWGGEWNGFKWNATAFWNRLHDAIVNVTIKTSPGGGALRQRRNAGDVEAFGFEGDITKEIAGNLALRAAASVTDARVRASGDAAQLDGKRPAEAPRVALTAGAIWKPVVPLRLSADLRWESARFDDDLNSRRLGSAFVLDLRAEWAFHEAWSAYVAVSNAADAKIATASDVGGVTNFDAPRTIGIGVSYVTEP